VGHDHFHAGLESFNAGDFFAAHEHWEDLWRETADDTRGFVQGLVQAAVGLHHYSTGNLTGARSVLRRGLRNMAHGRPPELGTDFSGLRAALNRWLAALETGATLPPFPRLEPASGDKIPPSVSKTMAPRRSAASGEAAVQQVPMLDLKRQYDSIREEVMEAVDRVFASQHLIGGPELEAFEQEMRTATGAPVALGCASGTDALWLALAAVGVNAGDTVVTSPFSFVASGTAIVRAGGRPLFVDIDPRTLNLDPVKVEARLRAQLPNKLRALLPVHLYGQCADMDAFTRIAGEFKAAVVEDAAQAFGASWRGKWAGSLGTAAGFSFYPTKNLSAFGDGGAVTASDEKYAECIRLLRNHGSRQRYYHQEMGWNSRLDAVQAAILRVKLKYLESWNRARAEHAARYEKLLRDAGLAAKSEGTEVSSEAPIRILETLLPAHHIYHQFVVRAERRDQLRAFLAERKIGTEIYYPVPLHLQDCFTYLGYAAGDLPEAERAAREVLALPIFAELTAGEQQYVVETIAEFYNSPR
jgi:dTDP-4-amino-4,6-dideoxygalactose transaminase